MRVVLFQTFSLPSPHRATYVVSTNSYLFALVHGHIHCWLRNNLDPNENSCMSHIPSLYLQQSIYNETIPCDAFTDVVFVLPRYSDFPVTAMTVYEEKENRFWWQQAGKMLFCLI